MTGQSVVDLYISRWQQTSKDSFQTVNLLTGLLGVMHKHCFCQWLIHFNVPNEDSLSPYVEVYKFFCVIFAMIMKFQSFASALTLTIEFIKNNSQRFYRIGPLQQTIWLQLPLLLVTLGCSHHFSLCCSSSLKITVFRVRRYMYNESNCSWW